MDHLISLLVSSDSFKEHGPPDYPTRDYGSVPSSPHDVRVSVDADAEYEDVEGITKL